MPSTNDHNIGYASKKHDRRKVLKKMTIGAGVIAGYSVLPEKWTTPIIGQIALPAHATTSGTTAIDATDVADGTYNTTETFSLSKSPDNRRYTWLDKTGSAYGGEIKFVFDGGDELVVPDAKVTHGADGSTSNHYQAYYFCGTDFAPGTPEYNGKLASVFAAPGSSASSVTLHYNK
jgi:hypothetical protein